MKSLNYWPKEFLGKLPEKLAMKFIEGIFNESVKHRSNSQSHHRRNYRWSEEFPKKYLEKIQKIVGKNYTQIAETSFRSKI